MTGGNPCGARCLDLAPPFIISDLSVWCWRSAGRSSFPPGGIARRVDARRGSRHHAQAKAFVRQNSESQRSDKPPEIRYSSRTRTPICYVAIARRRRCSRADTRWQGSTGSQLGEQREYTAGPVPRESSPAVQPREETCTEPKPEESKPKERDDPETEHAARVAGTAEAKTAPRPKAAKAVPGSNSNKQKPLSLDINRKPELLEFAATFPIRDELPSALRQLHSAVTRKCSPTPSDPDGIFMLRSS